MSSDQLGTDPGNRSAADLEREVDRERGRIDQTIDALQEKLSVGNLVDQVLHSVSDYGGDIGRNVARTARDNPLPLLLTGIGLVWLMTSAGGHRRHEFAHEHEYEPDGRSYDSGTYSDDWSRSTTDSVRDTAENLAGAASGAADATMDAARTARERVGEFAEKAEGGARRAGEWAGEAAHRVGEAAHRVGEAAHRVGDTAAHAKARAAQAGRAAQRGFQTLLEEQPLVLGAIAVAIGAAIGGALPRTRAEDRIMGQHSDRLYRKAKQAAGAVADEARVMAGEAAERFQENAPRWAEQAKEKAQETGARLRDAAESATGVNLDKP